MSWMKKRQRTAARNSIDPKDQPKARLEDLHEHQGHQELYRYPGRGNIYQ
jgi:hypothetical protein